MNINKISNNSPLARGVAGGTRRGVANSTSAAQKGCRVAPVGLVATVLCAIIVATAAFATGENVIASKKYTDDTFQTKISTDLVSLGDDWIEDLPSLVSYDETSGLVGNKYGILDYNGSFNYVDDGWYNYQEDDETNLLIPTVGAVGRELQNIWDNLLPPPVPWTNTETAAVNNYSTTFNGATNNWPSSDVYDMVTGFSLANGLALKQTKIPAGTATIDNTAVPSVVAYTDTAGSVGEIGVLDIDTYNDLMMDLLTTYPGSTRGGEWDATMVDRLREDYSDNLVSAGAVTQMILDDGALRQLKILRSGYKFAGGDNSTAYNTNAPSAQNETSWLSPEVKGTGLVTRTATDGQIGERKIFESTDVANYHAAALSQNEKDIQDISIPTVGAMMTAIQNGSAALIPAGTAGNVVTYTGTAGVVGSVATYDGSTTYNSATDASKVAIMSAVQRKKVCAGWPSDVAVADRTDANCWLWYFPD